MGTDLRIFSFFFSFGSFFIYSLCFIAHCLLGDSPVSRAILLQQVFLQAVFGCPILRCQTNLFGAFYKLVCLGGMKQCEAGWGTSTCAVPVLSVTSPSTTVFSPYVPSYTCTYTLNTLVV